jgi:hypothetical protein
MHRIVPIAAVRSGDDGAQVSVDRSRSGRQAANAVRARRLGGN